jgi:hypothetical protein
MSEAGSTWKRAMDWEIPGIDPPRPWWKSILIAGSVMAFICAPFAIGVMELLVYIVTRQWIGLP